MDFDVVIIGAGVIGLSIAYKLLDEDGSLTVLLIEQDSVFGAGASSRNSEVIHAGIYYQPGSLKAKLCLRGKSLLYEYCEKNNIKYKKLGKLFVAQDNSQVEQLEVTKQQAIKNGLEDLVFISKKELESIEPQLKSELALLSPSTGIFDSHAFMQSLLAKSQSLGLIYSPNSKFTEASEINNGWEVIFGEVRPQMVTSRLVINSTGIMAPDISKSVFPDDLSIPEKYPIKGSYLRYKGKLKLNHIIYPALSPGNIVERVDATPDLNGNIRFGPDIEEVFSCDDFRVNSALIDKFFPIINSYFKNIDKEKLMLDFSGIRPKINTGVKGQANDFIIKNRSDSKWIDLFGLESPGLTSSLAVGEHVASIAKSYLE